MTDKKLTRRTFLTKAAAAGLAATAVGKFIGVDLAHAQPGSGEVHDTCFLVRDLAGFTIAAPPDVILGVEASAAEFAGGASYRVGGFARDYASGAVAALVPAAGVNDAGALNTPDWPTPNHQFVFQLPATVTDAAVPGGIVELVGAVRVGAEIAGPEVDFVTGRFMWVV